MHGPPAHRLPGRWKMIGFSIEVETDPVTLLLQTDRGPFSVEIPKAQLANLIYALRFVSYADEPLQRKRLKKQAEGKRSFASVGAPKEKEELVKRKEARNRNRWARLPQKTDTSPNICRGLLGFSAKLKL